MNINMEQFLSENILFDLRKSLNFIPKGRSLRLVRIPILEFNDAISKALKYNPYIPFRPVIFENIPLDMTESLLPECIIVADDNTNLINNANKEYEIEV